VDAGLRCGVPTQDTQENIWQERDLVFSLTVLDYPFVAFAAAAIRFPSVSSNLE
jgi:hypothetical protein